MEVVKFIETWNNKRKKLLLLPRGSLKTTIGSIAYSIQRILQNPNIRILIASETYHQSITILREIKAKLESQQFKSFYGNWKSPELWRDSEIAVNRRTMKRRDPTISCMGVDVSRTGSHFDLIIVDDCHSQKNTTNSEQIEQVKSWYRLLLSMLEPEGQIMVIGCMVGDTRVLMADGVEKLLRDICIGDSVATYNNGHLSVSTVKNWTNSGCDNILAITTSSGKIVRANRRHPFLIYKDGKLQWIRAKNLTTAQQIVVLKDNGGSGRVKHVSNVVSPPNVEGSPLLRLNISDFTLDEIVSIKQDGFEDVFDVQIEKTENFIANGVVSHNTSWDFNDLYATIQNEMVDEYDIMVRKAVENGKLFFPSRLTADFLEDQRKEQGEAIFSAQYLLSPIATALQVFREKDIRFYDTVPDDLTVFMACDPSLTEDEKAKGDYTAIAVVGISEGNDWYILDLVNEHLSPDQINQGLFELYRKWGPVKIGIESVAFSKLLKPAFEKYVWALGFHPYIEELKSGGKAKELRIKSLQPLYEQGKVYMPKPDFVNNDVYAVLYGQLLHFPKNKFDDIIDSLSYVSQLAYYRPVKPQLNEVQKHIQKRKKQEKQKAFSQAYSL